MNFQKFDEIFNRKNYPVFNENYLPMDDYPCICLSGEKYRNCCKKDVEEALQHENGEKECEELKKKYCKNTKKLISTKIVNKAINKKNISYCLAEKVFGNCNACNNVKSHTLAKGSILSNLADNNNVLIAFNDHQMIDKKLFDDNIDAYYMDVSIDDASLAVSYCKDHDRDLFLEIEADGKNQYSHTKIQNLEYALKSISFQVYYNLENIKYLAELIKTSKNVLGSYKGIESKLLMNYSVLVDELFQLYSLSQMILEDIKEYRQRGKISKLKTEYFKLPCKKINISCSEVIEEQSINYFINIVNAPEPYIIISYYENEKYITWINAKKKEFEDEKYKSFYMYDFILSFIITNAQNIYMNKCKFNQLSKEEKRFLYLVHREGTYYIPDNELKDMNNFFFDR